MAVGHERGVEMKQAVLPRHEHVLLQGDDAGIIQGVSARFLHIFEFFYLPAHQIDR